MGDARDLTPLFEPRSLAVVGASDDPAKWGNWLGVRALRATHRRRVHLVNRRAERVLGRPAHPSLAAIGEPIDLAVLAVPAAALEAAAREAMAVGARAIIAIAAPDGGPDRARDLDDRLAALAREAGVALLGPNCLGVFDADSELVLVPDDLPGGAIGLVTQSGNLALEIGLHARSAGLGLSRLASVGNQADLTTVDLIRALTTHERTRAIAVYAEDLGDGRDFVEAAGDAVAAGKPVVVLALTSTPATARAARSHTGALAADGAVIDAACRAAGAERVATPQELVDVAGALLGTAPTRGARVAVLADGGGHGAVAAGLVEAAGLAAPAFGDALRSRLAAMLPPTAAAGNPIDLAGGAERDVALFGRVATAVQDSGEVDALLVSGYFGGYAAYGDATARTELAAAESMVAGARRTGVALAVHTMHPASAAADALRDAGVPVHGDVARSVRALDALCRPAATGRRRLDGARPAASRVTRDGYADARKLLLDAGVVFAEARIVADDDAALAAAEDLGFPVALKALGALHKSDAGGVVLGIADARALAAALRDVRSRLDPPALSVERMADTAGGVELIVGARRDPRFGAVALVGIGGIHAEVLDDTAVALAPVDHDEALRMLGSLRGAALLGAQRGRPPIHVDAAADAVVRVSAVAAAHPEIAEIEVNPLLAAPDAATALDARVVLAG